MGSLIRHPDQLISPFVGVWQHPMARPQYGGEVTHICTEDSDAIVFKTRGPAFASPDYNDLQRLIVKGHASIELYSFYIVDVDSGRGRIVFPSF